VAHPRCPGLRRSLAIREGISSFSSCWRQGCDVKRLRKLVIALVWSARQRKRYCWRRNAYRILVATSRGYPEIKREELGLIYALCRLELGSKLRTGEWTSDGGWQEVLETPLQMPSDLPQIHHSCLRKVWGPIFSLSHGRQSTLQCYLLYA